jgi:hypothetical protein
LDLWVKKENTTGTVETADASLNLRNKKSPTLSNFGESEREATSKKKALKSSFSCTYFIKKGVQIQ